MSGNHSTVVSIKSSFLRTQIRILSQPLQASEQFVKSTSIPTSTVREVAREANRILRRHNKATYPAISIRHVAEQIDRLYWDATIPESDAEADQGDISGGEETLRANDNFNSDKSIEKLPSEWEDDQGYEDSVSALKELAAQRAALRRKIKAYNALLDLLQPFEEPLESVQPNLATRDSGLVTELSKIRTLSVRAAGRITGWADSGDREGQGRGSQDDIGINEHERLSKVLGML